MNHGLLLAQANDAIEAHLLAKIDGNAERIAWTHAELTRVQGFLKQAKRDGETITLMKGAMRSPMRLAG